MQFSDEEKWKNILCIKQGYIPTMATIRSTPFKSTAEPFAKMNRKVLLSILNKIRDGMLTTEEVQDWASEIEMREEWCFEDTADEAVYDIFYQLSNKDLHPLLKSVDVDEMILRLS